MSMYSVTFHLKKKLQSVLGAHDMNSDGRDLFGRQFVPRALNNSSLGNASINHLDPRPAER